MLGWFTPRVFLGAAQRRLMGRGTLVLAYHKLGEAPGATKDPFLYETREMFSAQLRALRRMGAVPGLLGEFEQGALGPLPHATQTGANHLGQSQSAPRSAGTHGQSLPRTPDTAIITFDDGTLDSLELGAPVLREHGFTAIQFLVSERLGGQNDWDIRKGDVPVRLMDVSQVRDWLGAGHEIGSHTRTHANLRRLAPGQAREEIFGSKKALEDLFGREIAHFSYPYGSWNERVRDLVMEAGYRTACTMDFGVNTGAVNRWELRRVFALSSLRLLGKLAHRLGRRLGVG